MPVYEYRCNQCRSKLSALIGMIANAAAPVCPKCGGKDLSRVMSRFASIRSDQERLESLGDPSALDDMDDPAAMRRWMSQMSKEMGEDGEDLGEALEEAMAEEAAPRGAIPGDAMTGEGMTDPGSPGSP